MFFFIFNVLYIVTLEKLNTILLLLLLLLILIISTKNNYHFYYIKTFLYSNIDIFNQNKKNNSLIYYVYKFCK